MGTEKRKIWKKCLTNIKHKIHIKSNIEDYASDYSIVLSKHLKLALAFAFVTR